MTIHEDRNRGDSPFIDPAAPRMSEVLDRLGTLALSPSRRRDLRSAVTTVCRWIGRDPAEVPANINWVHVRLRRLHPARIGISKKRFSNLKSDLLKALELCGCSRDRKDWLRPPSPEWRALLDRVEDKHDRWKLTQLAQYCSALGVAPEAVVDEHLAGLLRALEHETFIDRPLPKIAQAAATWNRLRAAVAGWPDRTLMAPRRKEPWTIPLERFPASFQADAARWTDRLANPCPLDEDAPVKPLRPATIQSRRFQLRQMASALVLAGRDIDSITSLADLVDLDAFKAALRQIMSRFGDRPTEAIHGLAVSLKAIATHHVKVDPDHLAEMQRICQRLNLEVHGLREKNRRRLEQLDDEENLAALVHLPVQLIRAAAKPGLRPHKAALLLQVAAAVEILLYAPMRIGNLVSLSLERHLREVRVRGERRLAISIPGREVKNGKDLHFELGPAAAEVVDLYRRDGRPVLLRAPSEYLFPAQDGGFRRPHTLSALIKQTILDFTGLEIHPHLFRSIAGKLHSLVQPGDYATLSHVIGDTLGTTMKAYAQFEQKAAIRHYQNSVDAARARYRRTG